MRPGRALGALARGKLALTWKQGSVPGHGLAPVVACEVGLRGQGPCSRDCWPHPFFASREGPWPLLQPEHPQGTTLGLPPGGAANPELLHTFTPKRRCRGDAWSFRAQLSPSRPEDRTHGWGWEVGGTGQTRHWQDTVPAWAVCPCPWGGGCPGVWAPRGGPWKGCPLPPIFSTRSQGAQPLRAGSWLWP